MAPKRDPSAANGAAQGARGSGRPPEEAARAAEGGFSGGDPVADVEVVEALATGAHLTCWRARRADGTEATVHAVLPGTDDATRDHFLAVAADLARQQRQRRIEGMLEIGAVDPLAAAYVGACAPLGTMLDLPVLDWDAEQQLDFAWHICAVLQRMHGAGIIHGFLRPENVLLDEALQPVLANTQAIDIAAECEENDEAGRQYRDFAAPEVRAGSEPDERSDVYSVGRLLHFALIGGAPHEPDEELPRLDSLAKAPPGLTRIVRKCTAFDPDRRYANVAALRLDLDRYRQDKPTGLRHPEIDDLARFSGRPPRDGAEAAASPPPRISLKPRKRVERQRASRRPSPDGAAPNGRPSARAEPRSPSWGPATRGVVAAVGALLLTGAVIQAYRSGSSSLLLFATSLVGAVLLGLAPPAYGTNRALSRTLNVLLCLAAVWLLDPVAVAADASPRYEGLTAAQVAERVKTLQELRAAGEVEFLSLDLAGADLQKLDLSGTVLDGSSLRDADCRGTDLSGASLLNVDVTNANFAGAELDGINATFLKGWSLARCDDSTTMPTGWRCAKGSPRLESDDS